MPANARLTRLIHNHTMRAIMPATMRQNKHKGRNNPRAILYRRVLPFDYRQILRIVTHYALKKGARSNPLRIGETKKPARAG